MGEGYVGGVLRHDTAYGATLKKVPNPYRWMPTVYSGGGPVQSITPYVDKAAVTSWYNTYLYTDTQLGAVPESGALAPHFSGAPGWGSSYKLSGQAAIGWNLKFDKDGKRFASGVPEFGAYGQWVKTYDPRLDSTFPGGSGSHRINNEATWTWSENPALHAGVYAYGRYQNGKRTFGIGMPTDGIDWGCIASWANVCEANDWTIFGRIFEPGPRWGNLKDIAQAGGAQPIVSSGGLLSFKYSAPQVALDTITEADLAEGSVKITAQQSWGERVNTINPKYTSPDHDWQPVVAGAVSVPTYVAEDGEEKVKEWPFNLVKDAEQAAQLAAYVLLDSRELTPIIIPCGPRMRAYRPGECLAIDLPMYGLQRDAIILQRDIDPATMTVTLTMVSEDPTKHDYALGRTANPPPTPSLGQTGEERDTLANAVESQMPVGDLSSDDVDSTIKAGGGVANDQVSTGAIQPNAVTIPWFVTASTPKSAGGTPTLILSMTIDKEEDESLLAVTAHVPLYGGDAVDVFVTYLLEQSAVPVASRIYQVKVDGNGPTYLPFNPTHFFDGVDAGTYDLKVLFERATANTTSTDGAYDVMAQEYLR
jgi:hypothetical protein